MEKMLLLLIQVWGWMHQRISRFGVKALAVNYAPLAVGLGAAVFVALSPELFGLTPVAYLLTVPMSVPVGVAAYIATDIALE